MYDAVVTITLRTSILDPEGKTVEHSLHQLGYANVQHVRIGKHIEFAVDAANEAEARSTIESVCSKLLANPVMEDYTYTIRESKEAAGR